MIGATIEPLDEQFGKKGAIKEWWLSRKFAHNSLLALFSVALDKTPSHWQILKHVFHKLSMQSHPLQVVYKQTVYYSVVKFHKTKAIWVEVGLR